MQRNEYLLAFFLGLLVLLGVAYESLRGGSKTAEVIITHPGKTPFDQSPLSATSTQQLLESETQPAKAAATSDSVLLFLNHATHSDLIKVTGIGEVYAQRILEERDMAGGFHSREQVLVINGIGPSKMNNLQSHVEKLQTQKPSIQPNLSPPVSQIRPSDPIRYNKIQRSQKININQATREQLMNIPGIGEHYADAILRERVRRQGFRTWEQVNEVPGIGEKRLRQIQEYFSLQ